MRKEIEKTIQKTDSLLSQNQVDLEIKNLRVLLKELKSALRNIIRNENKPIQMDILDRICSIYSLIGNYEEEEEYLKKLENSLISEKSEIYCVFLMKLANNSRNLNKFDEAWNLYNQAYDIAKSEALDKLDYIIQINMMKLIADWGESDSSKSNYYDLLKKMKKENHKRVSTISPKILAFPPRGLAKSSPHTVHFTIVLAEPNNICTLLQPEHFTLRNFVFGYGILDMIEKERI